MSIYAELSRIQRELKAPKNMFNKFGNYYYRNAEGILEAVKPMLNNLSLIINDEPVMIGERYYIKATVTLTDGKESVSAVAYAREDEQKKGMDGCQLTGACSSYARKYALNALLMIDDSKDSDDDTLSPKNPENAPEPPKAAPQAPKAAPQAPRPQAATVQQVPSLPQAAPVQEVPSQEAPQTKPEPTEVQKFLLGAMKDLRVARDITPAKNNKLFSDQRNALIKAGLAPNKALEQYTLSEAQSLIDAMWKNFDPMGTELKKDDRKPA